MKRIIFLLIISIVALSLLHWGYSKYKRAEYVSNALLFKEYVLTAAELTKSVIDKTDELKTKTAILKRKHESSYYKDKNEATNYGCIVLQQIMDNKWQMDDMKAYSKVILDSCLSGANMCLKVMRDYKDCYPSDHQSFEKAISLLRPIVRHYEENEFTKDFYLSSVKNIESILNQIAETDVNIGEITPESQKHLKRLRDDIVRKSYHGKIEIETAIIERFGDV